MIDALYLNGQQQLSFHSAYPEDWKVKRLPYAKPFYWSGAEGNILIQQLAIGDYLLHYCVLKFIRAVSISYEKKNTWQSILALNGSLKAPLRKHRPVELPQGNFVLLPDKHCTIPTHFSDHIEYHIISLEFKDLLYDEFASLLPWFKGSLKDLIIAKAPAAQSFPLRIYDLIRAQFHQPYRPVIQNAYFQLQIKQMLFTLLAQTFDNKEIQKLSQRDIETAQQAYQIITQDITLHYSNIELARKVGMNEASLKKIFRQYYGVGMFQLLQNQRFQKAHELLVQKELPMKQIATIVGYKHTTTFITEFQKYFGYTPLDLLRKTY